MNWRDLQELSRTRTREARALIRAGHDAGAYYLMGYAVECALKACIAKATERYEFPNKARVNASYSHDLEKLLGVAGLEEPFKAEATLNPALERSWAVT